MHTPKTPQQIVNELEQHTKDLKFSSDEHGHDCTALREYCELELLNYADIHVPLLISRIRQLERDMKIAEKWLDGIKYELEASVYTLEDDEFATTFFVRDYLYKARTTMPEDLA